MGFGSKEAKGDFRWDRSIPVRYAARRTRGAGLTSCRLPMYRARHLLPKPFPIALKGIEGSSSPIQSLNRAEGRFQAPPRLLRV